MRTNIEIEFKCKIDEKTYNRLIDAFNLRDAIFLQTNYYFDDEKLSLLSRRLVLRIRKKSDTYYKVTLKSQHHEETFEKHILLTKEQALDMLENGFNVNEFFDFDCFVKHRATLDNYRVSVVYENGKLFFDKCVYNDNVDYEIEYEALDYQKGLETFNNFLKAEKIPFMTSKKKSERAFGK
ncbi:CYTH domain-containing protein [Acholeplasma sp. OttesenSCG-928-E16]|nr:CYTH domain-containing protein [Acholeplasma sp. OttesenSCG-928-E16]